MTWIDDASSEQWLPAVGFEGCYEVSDRGRVKSLPRRRARGGIMKPSVNTHGYLRISLSRDGKPTDRRVHQMVLEAFAGPRPAGLVACHGEGGQLDNRWPENVSWGTYAQNNGTDRERDGTALRGEDNGNAKLSNAAVADIRRRYAAGRDGTGPRITQQRLADEYGVTQGNIGHIILGRSRS